MNITTDETKGLRILFVNRMASMIRGGGETFDLEMSRHLEKLGCTTSFLSGLPLFGRAKLPINRSRSYTIRSPYMGWFPWESVRGGWHLRKLDFVLFENRAADWAAARKDQFDIIQVCELPFFVDAWQKKKTGIPVVIRLTAPNYYDPVDAIKRADAVVASGTTIAKMQEGIRSDCFNIPNAVDTEYFCPQSSDFRGRYGVDASALILLYVARLVDFKGHQLLLEAFSGFLQHNKKARLILVGQGPAEKEIRKKIQELGLTHNVMLMGQVPYADLPSIYAAADIKVVSSDERESFCFAALEAMSAGLPIVATRCGMLPRLLEGEHGGVLVPVGDVKAFEKALCDLSADGALREKMGAYNRNKAVSEHGWAASAGMILRAYKSLLS